MKIFFYTIAILLFSAPQAFAHEEETEITNLAEADWIGPLIAFAILALAIVISRRIKKGRDQKLE